MTIRKIPEAASPVAFAEETPTKTASAPVRRGAASSRRPSYEDVAAAMLPNPDAAIVGAPQAVLQMVEEVSRVCREMMAGALEPPRLPAPISYEAIRDYYCGWGSPVASREFGRRQGHSLEELNAKGWVWQTNRDANDGKIHVPYYHHRRLTKGGANAPKHYSSARRPGSAVRTQRYIEKGNTVCKDPDGKSGVDTKQEPERVIAILGNLGPTPKERAQVWRDIEKIERENRGPLLVGDRLMNPDFWRSAHDQVDCPPELLECRGKKKTRLPVLDERFKEITDWCATIDFPCEVARKRGKTIVLMKDRSGARLESPIQASVGRGGTVVHRINAVLPWELRPERCVEIVRQFVDYFEQLGLPVCAAVHAPPPDGNPRNIHMHCVIYPRIAEKLPNGKWDFQIEADLLRVCPDATVRLKPKHEELGALPFRDIQRRRYIDLANAALKDANSQTVWIAGTLAEAKADRVARTPQTRRAYYEERRGIVSPGGRKAAAEFVDYRINAIRSARNQRYSDARRVLDRLELGELPKRDPYFRAVRLRAAEFLKLSRWIAVALHRNSLRGLAATCLHPGHLRCRIIDQQLAKPALPQARRAELQSERAFLATVHTPFMERVWQSRPDFIALGAERLLGRAHVLEAALTGLGPVGALFRKHDPLGIRIIAAHHHHAAEGRLPAPSKLLGVSVAASRVPAEGASAAASRPAGVATVPAQETNRHLQTQAHSRPGAGHAYATGNEPSALAPRLLSPPALPVKPQMQPASQPAAASEAGHNSPSSGKPSHAATRLEADRAMAPAPAPATASPTTEGAGQGDGANRTGGASPPMKSTPAAANSPRPLPASDSNPVPQPHSTLALSAGASIRSDQSPPGPTIQQANQPTKPAKEAVAPADIAPPPPHISSYGRGMRPLDEVLQLISHARAHIDGSAAGSTPALLHAPRAAHWLSHKERRAYLVAVLKQTTPSEAQLPVLQRIYDYALLTSAPVRPQPEPLTDQEFEELTTLFRLRGPSGFYLDQMREQARAEDLSYRLLLDHQPLVRHGYLTAVMKLGSDSPMQEAWRVSKCFLRVPMKDRFAEAWYNSVEGGESRALAAAIDAHVLKESAHSGLDADGQEMYARLIWLERFDAMFGGTDKIPSHIDRYKVGPKGHEYGQAADFFKTRTEAARILQQINPEMWNRLTERLRPVGAQIKIL